MSSEVSASIGNKFAQIPDDRSRSGMLCMLEHCDEEEQVGDVHEEEE